MNSSSFPTINSLLGYGIDVTTANRILTILQEAKRSANPEKYWQQLSKDVLLPDMPFELHLHLYKTVYSDNHDNCPAWIPDQETIDNANISRLQGKLRLSTYNELLRWAALNRLDFWKLMVDTLGITFIKSYDSIAEFTGNAENPEWLTGAEFNIAESCFRSQPDSVAIVYQPEGGSIETITYKELEILTNRVANGLTGLGFQKGVAIAIDMPMTAESVAIYLGIVKAGCVVVSIADSLAPSEVMKRLRIANTKAIFTQDVIIRGGKEIPLYDKLTRIDLPLAIVLPATQKLKTTLRSGDLTWDDFLSTDESFESICCTSVDFCNLLFSSGTTGDPKSIPWTHASPIKCAADGYLHHNIQGGDVVAWPTNLGWMMGPWLIFASLINKATIALFHGAPLGRDFGEFVQNANVNMLGVVPSIVKRWIETDCMKDLDWSSIKAFSSTGECSNSRDYFWLMSRAGYKPVIEYCGGTEIGGGYITGTMVQRASPATFTTPALGLDFVILDENGNDCRYGELFIVPPSIGLSGSLLNKDHHEIYYDNIPAIPNDMNGVSGVLINDLFNTLPVNPLLRRHGDEFEQVGENCFRAHGRADDTMNLGGIKVGSAEIERVLNTTENISETAAIAVDPPESGGGPSQLVICAVLQNKTQITADELQTQFQQAIKKELNPLFKVYDVVVLDALPRTASNKVMRRVLRKNYLENTREK